MKNQTTSLMNDNSELQAEKIISKIQKWTEKNYPRISVTPRLIMECLIEIAEEKKYRAAHK